jgi:hypothetical protein
MKVLNLLFRCVLCALLVISLPTYSSTVYADDNASSPAQTTSGDYDYTLNEDGAATIVNYHGPASQIMVASSLDGSASIVTSDGSASKLTIPSSLDGHPVTGIRGLAFASCLGLVSITIPDCVTFIEAGAFRNNPQLGEIIVSKDNLVYEAVDGVLFDKTTNTLHTYPCGKRMESFDIPAGTTALGDYSFYHIHGLITATIPDSVISIGECPFTGCSKLSTIAVSENSHSFTMVDGVLFDKATKTLVAYPCGKNATSYEIPLGTTTVGDNAFSSCIHLANVTIPNSVTSIGRAAFSSCENLTSIVLPDSITSIASHAFDFCTSLTASVIPSGVESIGAGVYFGCSSLGAISVSDNNPIYTGVDGVLFDKATNTLHTYPCGKSTTSYNIPNGTAAIGDFAFTFCDGLTSITIPDGVISIGEHTFSACDNLVSVSVPDSVNSIGFGSFEGNKNLTLNVVSNSYADTYATENALRYVEVLS